MTGIIYSIYSFIYHPNFYYFISSIFAFFVFNSQWKRGNRHIMSVIIPCFETFSITTATQYILMAVFITGSLPESLTFLDNIILALGAILGFLTIFAHESKDTWIGDRANNILNKYFLNKQIIGHTMDDHISPFTEYLGQIKLARNYIKNGDKDQIVDARNIFLENSKTILVLFDDSTQIQEIYNCCKNDFGDILNTETVDNKSRLKLSGSLSEFIGTVNGILKKTKK